MVNCQVTAATSCPVICSTSTSRDPRPGTTVPSPKEIVRHQRRAKDVRRQRFVRARNVSARSTVRTYVKRAREAIEAGDADAAQAAIREAQSHLDGAARKGIIHRRTAARSMSRLVRQLRAAQAA